MIKKYKSALEWAMSGSGMIVSAVNGLDLDMEENFSSDEMLEEALAYEGMIGYAYSIKRLMEDLYEEEEFTFEYDELRAFCIENNYFTAGTSKQYEKMFRKAEYGIKLSELALIIDMCSEHTAEDIIYRKLFELVERRRKLEEELAVEELEFVLDEEDLEAELYDDGGII